MCDALAAARAIEKWADCGLLPHEIVTTRSSGAQEHQISLFFEVPNSCSFGFIAYSSRVNANTNEAPMIAPISPSAAAVPGTNASQYRKLAVMVWLPTAKPKRMLSPVPQMAPPIVARMIAVGPSHAWQ